MNSSRLWLWKENVDTSYDFGEMLVRDETLGVINDRELLHAEYALAVKRMGQDGEGLPLPTDFPAPRLRMPANGFAPDYFSFGVYHFCSRRLRDALAQPESVIEFCLVELISGGPEAVAQDYRLQRILASQSAMDVARSDCEIDELQNQLNGERRTFARYITRIALLDGLVPRFDVFRVAETLNYVLVTDALADRVLRAGCTGVEFCDPGSAQRSACHPLPHQGRRRGTPSRVPRLRCRLRRRLAPR